MRSTANDSNQLLGLTTADKPTAAPSGTVGTILPWAFGLLSGLRMLRGERSLPAYSRARRGAHESPAAGFAYREFLSAPGFYSDENRNCTHQPTTDLIRRSSRQHPCASPALQRFKRLAPSRSVRFEAVTTLEGRASVTDQHPV